jgi:hypothetical protein
MVKNVPRAPFSKPESVLEQAEGPSLEYFESWAVGQTHATLQKPEGPTAEEQATTYKNLVIAVESERKALQLRRALVARRRELLSKLSVRKERGK